ncbi:MAG: (d)CMP kinase [Gammaproteobacteria bacterium]|nr:(d)CMP kinase [Gammaproteobacteria bacterium]
MSVPVVTIDGPSGSGKGTISLTIAQKLGWHFLDSGALYRLLALSLLNNNLSFDDESVMADMARGLDIHFSAETGGEVEIYLENKQVTNEIRTEKCGNAASKVAAVPAVREALLERQRGFRQPPGLVADGRDMGTVVFPDAPLKIFLTASAEERAKRRYNQLKQKGIDANLAALQDEIAERDKRDAGRAVSPLKAAEDAVIIDSTHMSIDEVVTQIMALCQDSILKK